MADETPARITLVVGSEELLVDRAVTAIVQAVRAEDPDADVRDLGVTGLERGTVTELASPSLFGERKVIVLRGAQDAAEELVSELRGYVAAPAEDVTLVLTHKGGQRGAGLVRAARDAGADEVSCAPPKGRRERLAFVSGEFAALRRRATPDAVATLLDAVGNDLRELAGAVAQLCADTTGTIGDEVVRRYYAGHADVSGFTVADRAVEGRAGEALVQLRYALQSGTDPVLVVAALAMALRSLVKVASAPRGMSEADLVRELKMPPWKIRTVRRQQLPGWDAEGVAVALTAVAAADASVKGGAADPLYAVEKAVVTIARARGRR